MRHLMLLEMQDQSAPRRLRRGAVSKAQGASSALSGPVQALLPRAGVEQAPPPTPTSDESEAARARVQRALADRRAQAQLGWLKYHRAQPTTHAMFRRLECTLYVYIYKFFRACLARF